MSGRRWSLRRKGLVIEKGDERDLAGADSTKTGREGVVSR
jgi:hypothetical protein